jgi:hypothetical protein
LIQQQSVLNILNKDLPFSQPPPSVVHTMAPAAITPPQGVQQTAELTAAAVAQKITETAPAQAKQLK